MKILTVIPIGKGIPREEISYFSARSVTLGTLVTAPFGKRSIMGVVVDQEEVRDLKSSIKTSNFALRNISEIHKDKELPSGVFTAAQKTARFFAQPVGAVLETMIPKQIFDYYLKNSITLVPEKKNLDIQATQIPFHERVSFYKTLVRENFAKQLSTMIIAPTVIQAEKIFEILQNGIEDRIVVAHSKKTKGALEKTISKIITKKEPLVFVATAPFVSLIRNDWNTIIIEQSSSPYYRYEFGPVFDMRFFVEEMARAAGSRLIYADTLLSLSVRSRVKNYEITDIRSTWHITKPEDFQLIDMKQTNTLPADTPRTQQSIPTKIPFRTLHEKTFELLHQAIARKANTLLVTARKGLAPLTVCGDCGTPVTCPICGTPLVLHRKKTSHAEELARIYMCHHCMHTTQPIDRCLQCGSWRLTPLGVSTDSIRLELESTFPKLKTFLIDGDMTPSVIQKTIKSWKVSEGSALIATPVILSYLDTVDYGCMVSMDSLLSLPSYTSGEFALHTALSFLEKIQVGAIIQTRAKDNEVVQAISTENIFDFIKNELDTRKQFNYPPAKVLLRISLETKKESLKEVASYLETIFKTYDPDILIKRAKKITQVIVQAVMKIDLSTWGDFESPIHQTVKDLSREFKKEVNPDTIL